MNCFVCVGRSKVLNKSGQILTMPITFRPKPGQVLYCDFTGYIAPEIIKTRPVVIISPAHLARPSLVTVVPLSTTAPSPVEGHHYKLTGNPIPGSTAGEVWAKCDLVATVCFDRLDRIKISRGLYQTGNISMEQVKAIRRAGLIALGIDLSNPQTYT
jgi:uncharacterized protein YifN (PemK superfamily)